MEQPRTLPGSGKISLVYGLIAGLIVGTLDSIYSFYTSATNPPFVQALFNAFPLAVLSELDGLFIF
jgi:hypothetical protein